MIPSWDQRRQLVGSAPMAVLAIPWLHSKRMQCGVAASAYYVAALPSLALR
jgi:hypothetical protein